MIVELRFDASRGESIVVSRHLICILHAGVLGSGLRRGGDGQLEGGSRSAGENGPVTCATLGETEAQGHPSTVNVLLSTNTVLN
jgi:hypothetical protein